MSGEAKGPVLMQPEADRLVEQLKVIKLEEIGGKAWMKQHQTIEKLNMQAQMCVMQNSDEFVIESLIDHEKIHFLIQDLLATEVFKEKAWKTAKKELASSHYVKLYLLVYHEAVVLGLLEKAFFTTTAISSTSDILVDLADYCYRRTVFLNQVDPAKIDEEPQGKEEIMAVTDEQRLDAQKLKIEFGCAMSALTILRFLSENVPSVPLAVISRLLAEQDILLTVVPLLDKRPWKRTVKGKKEKYDDGRWREEGADDQHRLGKTEAQVWLLVNNMLLDPDCRRKYEWSEHRKANVMQLSKYFNELLIDQLPVLSDLRRFVETLGFSAPPQSSEARGVVIEQVPEVREALLKADWKAIAQAFVLMLKNESPEDQRQEMQELAGMYDALDLDQLLDDPKCSSCGEPATQRCSRCKLEWYCSRKCQVAAWKQHKPLCTQLCEGGAGRGGGGGGGGVEKSVIGGGGAGKEEAKPQPKIQMLP